MWLPAFQLQMYAQCDALPKGDLVDMFVEEIPSRYSFWQFGASSPYQKLEILESGSMFRQLCIMVASCPSLCCSGRKKMCFMQRSRGFGRGVVFSKICYSTVIVFSVVLCDCCKPTNNCRDGAFSNSGLEVWLPAFQLHMYAKCDALPKSDLYDMFV